MQRKDHGLIWGYWVAPLLVFTLIGVLIRYYIWAGVALGTIVLCVGIWLGPYLYEDWRDHRRNRRS